ncbi:CIR protein [Plasmodium chabaudi adami]|uniref:CIR protein n=1 Tax=Plasmodium chabaudi adami TaxID=5826 RepID=A0A1D3L818_PLACE|nr:CIR protein [Plasmodium chabaudi adami]
MAESSYDIEKVYYEIYTINNYFWEDNGKLKVNPKSTSIHDYCYYSNTPGKDKCNDYLEMTKCSVIYLLKTLKETYKLKDDKIAEYAILWLNYNLNINSNNNFTNLNEFYTKYIVNNNCYNDKTKGDDITTYKNIIDANKDLTNMNIKEISKFSDPFSILFYLYYAYHYDSSDCNKNLGYAKQFADQFNNLNDDSNNIENSLYNKLLSTLSNDYNNLKKIFYDKNDSCEFPSLPQIKPKKNSAQNSGKGSGQIMGQSSYSIEDVCEAIVKVDTDFTVDPDDSTLNSEDFPGLINYCPFSNNGSDHKCSSYEELVSSAFITMLVSFISSNGDENLDRDKFAEYAILWLCYQLNQKTKNRIDNLNNYYNTYIKGIEKYSDKLEDAETYNSCKDIINKKQYLMNMDINKMSKLYEALKILCDMYTECNGKEERYTSCSKDAEEFVQKFEELNNDPSITGNDSYREILSSLSTNYNNFKNDCAKKCSKCSDIPTLTDIKVPKSSVQDQVESSGVTSPSSSIASTLIPGLSTFAIPVFLGVAYKYSLFGFDKLFQRQHIRNKLKKIKNKMELNI